MNFLPDQEEFGGYGKISLRRRGSKAPLNKNKKIKETSRGEL
jgi:hypothetical protein